MKMQNVLRRVKYRITSMIIRSDEKYLRFIGVKIGKNCLISTRKVSSEPYLITIGDYVRIAKDTIFFTHGGLWSVKRKHNDKSKLAYYGKIEIGNYTYIGEGCMIMPGVKIGSNVIIGAGSVVTKSVPDNCMVAGNPIKYIGNTDDFYFKIKKHNASSSGLPYEKKKELLLSLDDSIFMKKPYVKID
jgi:acetyltransferase-like isoleucine patch superfamily enzyme